MPVQFRDFLVGFAFRGLRRLSLEVNPAARDPAEQRRHRPAGLKQQLHKIDSVYSGTNLNLTTEGHRLCGKESGDRDLPRFVF